MALTMNVPSIVCDGCVSTITEAITTHDPTAKVTGSVDNKTVTVDGSASETSLKEVIEATGHTVA